MKRHENAWHIQQGACNPIAIANALVEAINEVRAEDPSTDTICNDSAVRLICHQLAYLLHVPQFDNDLTAYSDAYSDVCRKAGKTE